ncbi:pseudouridine synthase [Marinobacter salicampi]|uniref:pseudouridine synthase n=1 Tax=Marinobacter salicampi TaxID=435907 RepID=UPI00140A574F|nr:16S rRNA pseudouridine(516) synthase [Marinobacter salicampi]
MRLDRLLCKHTGQSYSTTREWVSAGHVIVDGEVIRTPGHIIDRFSEVKLQGARLQGQPRHYLMLNKPAGYLSATSDLVHPTVMELVPTELRSLLHIAGRLDRASTGLLILTSDGQWSRCLTDPGGKKPKVYRVRTLEPVSSEAPERFAQGIYLARENLTTTPAQIEVLGSHEARVTIYEGRHHQVKRMFAAVGNEVTALHRECMGVIELEDSLEPGGWRPLTGAEIASVSVKVKQGTD